MPKALSPVPPRVFLNACHVSSQAGSQCARHAALLASFLDTFSLLLIASGPLSHLAFCFLIQGIPLHLPLAQHSTSFTELSREVPRENGAGLLKGIHLCNEQCNVHIPAYLHRNLHTKATLQREGFFFFSFSFLMPSHSSISYSSKNTIGITLTGRQNNFQGCWVRNNSFARPINVSSQWSIKLLFSTYSQASSYGVEGGKLPF